jgi:hypothetical protein
MNVFYDLGIYGKETIVSNFMIWVFATKSQTVSQNSFKNQFSVAKCGFSPCRYWLLCVPNGRCEAEKSFFCSFLFAERLFMLLPKI